MIPLQKLIAAIPAATLAGTVSRKEKVRGVTSDSRLVKQGFVFVALKGEKDDGHSFVKDAIKRGCLIVVVENEVKVPSGFPFIKVADSHLAYGQMAAAYYDHPARKMKVIGITGTNGKTTSSWMIEKVIEENGGKPGVIGTINYRYRSPDGRKIIAEAPLTTPEPMIMQGMLRKMADTGVSYLILEVSSHALVQKRVTGLKFDIAVFTNLSRDHLDYHQSMEEYFRAKMMLFDDYMKSAGIAVIATNQEKSDNAKHVSWGKKVISHLKESSFEKYPGRKKIKSFMTCGFEKNCTVRAGSIAENVKGIEFTLFMAGKQNKIISPLIGFHNVSNMLVAAGTGLALGIGQQKIKQGLQDLGNIPGRLERVELPSGKSSKLRPAVFVDYAHTPDALEHVLQSLRPITKGRLICVFGCGGDRDRGKRQIMGAVAGRKADLLVLTSDNPRSENPKHILAEIEKGVIKSGLGKHRLDKLLKCQQKQKCYAITAERRRAIHHVCNQAQQGDVILIAGKGHETYQITKEGKRFFDDRIEARNGVMRWTVEHLLSATNGKLRAKGTIKLLGNISTDTRTLEPGDIFVALQGDNFDGHDFVKAAVKKGVAAVVVQHECKSISKKTAVVQVKDTLQALGRLAHYRRQLLGRDVTVISITGSSGKTTVKEMTAAILDADSSDEPGQQVLKTQGNLNNLIGLPLSLLNINAGHRVAVLEMGMNRPGEIKRLTNIANPDIGCITNVQPAHLEGLGTVMGVAKAKGELFSTMASRGVRIVNLDDPQIRKLGAGYGDNAITFAVTPIGRRFNPFVRATRIASLGEKGMRFTLHIGSWKRRVTVKATGAHNVGNCTAAAAIATAVGVRPELIIQGLGSYQHGDKRLQIVELPGGIHVVNDSYNANPASMAAALQTVRDFGRKCKRVALLGDMFELGESAGEAHRKIGTMVAELQYDYLGFTGEYAKIVAEMAIKGGSDISRVKAARDKEELAKWVLGLISTGLLGEGDWLLVKGSRGMRMEKVLQFIQKKLQQNKN